MGIGVEKRDVQKQALLINGDTASGLSEEHAKNLRILDTFLSQQGFQITKVEGSEITQEKLSRLVEGMRQKMDGDDELFLYITGHGDLQNGEECAVVDGMESLPLRWIDEVTRSLNYKERTVWLDGCFSGGALRYFSQDPKTLFVAAGSKDETVACYQFTPPAFEKGKDLNGDGVISFGERFIAGAENVRAQKATFSPIYFAGRDYEDNGVDGRNVKPPFETGMVSVSDPASLKKELSRLRPGEYAVVDFSASWCGPCQSYKPEFEKMALEDGGKHLWIRAEGDGEPWGDWEVTGYPTVKIFHVGDPGGHAIGDRENPLNEIPSALEDDTVRTESLVENLVNRMDNGLVSETKDAAEKLAPLLEKGKISPKIFLKFWYERPGARVGLVLALASAGENDPESVIDFLKNVLSFDPYELVRKAAVEALPRPLWDLRTRVEYPWVAGVKDVLVKSSFTDSSSHVRDAAVGQLLLHSFSNEEKKTWIERIGKRISSGYWGPINGMQLLMKFYEADPSRVGALVYGFLSHSDWLVRREAAQVIEEYSQYFILKTSDPTKFIGQLRKMVDADSIAEVRLFAATALVGGLGDKYPSAVPLLVEEMKNWGSRTFLRIKTNREEFTDDEVLSFLSSSRWKCSVSLRLLQSMGELAKGAVPDLIEEIRLYPEGTGKMRDILQTIFNLDRFGFLGHLKTIWAQSKDPLVDQLVLDQATWLGEKGVELLEGFLKEEALNAKGALGSSSESELKWRLANLRERVEEALRQMRAAP